MASDMGDKMRLSGVGWQEAHDQTASNIRERGGRRKQKPVRRPESRSKRIRYPGRAGVVSWLRGAFGVAPVQWTV